MTDSVTVEQCDRDAAAAWGTNRPVTWAPDFLKSVAKLLAHHRVAERERCLSFCDKTYRAVGSHPPGADILNRGRTDESRRIAQAIREPKP